MEPQCIKSIQKNVVNIIDESELGVQLVVYLSAPMENYMMSCIAHAHVEHQIFRD